MEDYTHLFKGIKRGKKASRVWHEFRRDLEKIHKVVVKRNSRPVAVYSHPSLFLRDSFGLCGRTIWCFVLGLTHTDFLYVSSLRFFSKVRPRNPIFCQDGLPQTRFIPLITEAIPELSAEIFRVFTEISSVDSRGRPNILKKSENVKHPNNPVQNDLRSPDFAA